MKVLREKTEADLSKHLIVRVLLPVLVVLIGLRLFTKSAFLERIKHRINYNYYFTRLLLLIVIGGLLIFGLERVTRRFTPAEKQYPVRVGGGRSGDLPPPVHGRTRRK